MALERVGLGGVFAFDEKQGVAAMGRARDELGRFTGMGGRAGATFTKLGTDVSASFNKIGASIGQMGRALGGLGLAGLPVTAALGVGVSQAADFEKQMSAVKAITLATGEDMNMLTLKAKQMGATTVFTATQSAQAMEELGRAGFSTSEIMDGLSGVMNAASADSIDLATSASIVSNVIRGMNLAASDATRVADVLALTSAKSNTDIIGLGEAFKYAAAQGKNMGIPLEETAAALGAVADAGLKGSIGGTSFTNMLIKMAAPSEKAMAINQALGTRLIKNADGTLNFTETIRLYNNALSKVPDRVQRASMATELFGIRGQKAFAALGTSLDTMHPDSGKSRLDTLNDMLLKAKGTAEQMAMTRLDNFSGQIVLMKSAIEGFSLETAGLFLKPLTDNVKGFTASLSSVVQVLQLINAGTLNDADATKKYGVTAVAVAKGIHEGITEVISAFKRLRAMVVDTIKRFTGGTDAATTQAVTKFITMAVVIVGALAPILVAIGGIAFFVSTVLIPGFTALGTVIASVAGVFSSALVSPVILGIAAISAAIYLMRDSVMKGFAVFMEYASPMFNFLKEQVLEFVASSITSIMGFWQTFKQVFEFMSPIAELAFGFIGHLAGITFQILSMAFVGLMKVVSTVFDVIKTVVKFIVEDTVDAIQLFVKAIVRLADAVNFDVSPQLRTFANQGQFRVMEDAPVTADDVTGFGANLANMITGQKADQKKAAAEPPKVEANVTVEDKRCLEINNKLTMDGKEIAIGQAKHAQEINERTGFKQQRWQQRFALEQGATPVNGGA